MAASLAAAYAQKDYDTLAHYVRRNAKMRDGER